MRKIQIAELPNGGVRWSHRFDDPEALCVIVQPSGLARIKSYKEVIATFRGGGDVAVEALDKFEQWLDVNAKKGDRRPCERCEGTSFVGERVCRLCEGTGRTGD